MNSELPKIEPKKCSDTYKQLKELVLHYTPEWAGSDGKDAGVALLKIFSHINENVVNRFNQAPKKNFVAFLDMLGIKLLPAQPSRVPLTFNLAKGTEKEILVPAKTQASSDKTDEHEELPFETEKNLLATPGQLKKVISIDPEKDAIYKPPPGFLNGKQQKESQVSYEIVSSPSAGSRNFQLDNVTDLVAGDFLGIGEKNKEYVIISNISGMIIHITDPLLSEYPSSTPVEKITKFNLFEGKNMQEHSVYMGHNDLFNIKSTAQFTLFINHRPGTETGVTPLKLSWQYWGEVEGEEGEDWREFNANDGTQGLSKTGTVELNKITEGEIKEKELIKDLKSRWIRCIVKEPLGTGVSRKLPKLDNIVFKVRSSGENLLPDQAFNNDTPLDITQAFTPFGKEPRMFDYFSIASKEIFSKKGAKIEMDVDVEKRGVLGGPTAVEFKQKIKVFARGTFGRLAEVEIDPSGEKEPEWIDHGFPPDTKIAPESTPSAVTYSGKDEYISVFASAENGHLVERFFNGNQWIWIDHGVPEEGVKVVFDPAAITDFTGCEPVYVISVFVTGSDGLIHELNRDPDTTAGRWIHHEPPGNVAFDSSPYADSYAGIVTDGEFSVNVIKVKVFVKDKKGRLHELDCMAGDSRYDVWKDYGLLDPANGIKAGSRPFAMVYINTPPIGMVSSDIIGNGTHQAKVFAKGSDDQLWEFSTFSKDETNQAISLEVPEDEKGNKITIISNPHGYITSPGSEINNEDKHIFVRGTDGRLWERIDDRPDKKNWKSHHSPANLNLSFSPFVLHERLQKILSIFSASDKNSIIERDTEKETWNEYKDPIETALTPALSWEYWNKKGWVVIKGIKDETSNLLKSGKIMFDLPQDAEETEIAGQKSSWIRARIVGGDYGEKTFALLEELDERKKQKLISTKDSIRPPVINRLTISYALETKQYPQKVWTYNNLEYLDQTDASKIEDKFFQPFVQLEERVRTIYLGFEKSFKGGPINIFFAAKELQFIEEKKPKLEWSYSVKNDWKELKGYLDYTEGLIKRDILELMGHLDFTSQFRFGDSLYWIKGSLTRGEYEESPILDGIYLNTAWALQAETIKDEILGSSDGSADQKFSFLKFPVLEGQEIRVCEILSEEEKQEIIALSGEKAIKEEKDEKGKVIETCVLWTEVPDFFESKPRDRHYILDRAMGQLQFGDGINGMIPPIQDNNIKAASYQSGGGKQGNVSAVEIKTLKSAVAGVESVSNPVAADGGADTATLDEMLEIGPAMIDHRDRAVTAEDFEWLAKNASRKVIKVRCLPNINNRRQKEIGWITVIIVPDSLEAKPCPSLELRKKVRQHLEARSANTLSHKRHVNVDSPSYVEVSVSVDVFVTSLDKISEVEREVKKKLDAFFHPLTGGPEEKGWDFGRDVSASDIYALLEDIEGVDHVENLKFSHNYEPCLFDIDQNIDCKEKILKNGNSDGDIVKVNENFLIANGTHIINLQPITEDKSYESA
ncbi:MAG TPA: putative baseplate assembly protein [Candidatus Methanoperedens sp.]|nr:putative baseplate assembly protein [Candidatus Methanoperedens sp.]